MSTNGIRRAGLAAAAALLVGMVGSWSTASGHGHVPDPPVVHLMATTASGGLAIGATTVTGLYPGARASLRLVVGNPYDFDIRVVALSGKLIGTSRNTCAASAKNLMVGDYQGPPAPPVLISRRGTRTVGTIPLSMPNTVANACQNTTFTVQLSGTAVKAAQ